MSERELPMANGAEGGNAGASTPVGLPPQVEASSLRLVGTLAIAGALAGLAIVLVFQWANPQIEEYRARMLAEAITEVLAGADRYETLFLDGTALTTTPVADTADLDRVYVGLDANGRPIGIAVQAGEPGFQDVITLIFGYDPDSDQLLGMKVLEHKETPGLGDKIEKDTAFVGAFDRVETPVLGVKKGRESGAGEEVVLITGATISSRAVIDIINRRLHLLRSPMSGYWASTVHADASESARASPPGAASQPTVARPGGTP